MRSRWLLVALLVMLLVGVGSATTLTINLSSDVYDWYVGTTTDGNLTAIRSSTTGLVHGDGTSATTRVLMLQALTTQDNWSAMRRFAYSFDGPAIPDTADITSATLSIYPVLAENGVGDLAIGLTGITPLASGGFQAADYPNVTDTRYASDIPYASIVNTSYVNFTFNEDGIAAISKTGRFNLAMRFAAEIDNNQSAITWASAGISALKVNDYTEGGVGKEPFMTITYEDGAPSEAIEYYAYGDSITRATGGDDLASNGTDVYLTQMVETHDAINTSDNNLDGGSTTSAWGLANFATHGQYEGTEPERVFIMFGTNDRYYGLTGLQTAANLAGIYEGYTANGTSAYVLIHPLKSENGHEWNIYENQYSNITIIETNLTERGIPFVKMYDAIDSNPGNGSPDEVNSTLYYDSVHPNYEGHTLMGEFLWAYLEAEAPAPAPVAAFTANTTAGVSPLAVAFTDSSTNAPTDWDWYIDDVKFSDLQNPEYTFTDVGVYNVTLYAANGASGDSATEYITVTGSVPSVQCQNLTGNITVSLFSNSTTSLGWLWSDPGNITKIAEDGMYVLAFDNSSNSFIGAGYLPESWHRLRIYNQTDFGQLNCTTDELVMTPTPIPIMPSTESNANLNLLQYWPYALALLGFFLVIRK